MAPGSTLPPPKYPHLQQHVDLGSGLVQRLLDGDGHALHQLGQLQLLLLPAGETGSEGGGCGGAPVRGEPVGGGPAWGH